MDEVNDLIFMQRVVTKDPLDPVARMAYADALECCGRSGTRQRLLAEYLLQQPCVVRPEIEHAVTQGLWDIIRRTRLMPVSDRGNTVQHLTRQMRNPFEVRFRFANRAPCEAHLTYRVSYSETVDGPVFRWGYSSVDLSSVSYDSTLRVLSKDVVSLTLMPDDPPGSSSVIIHTVTDNAPLLTAFKKGESNG